MSEQFTNFTPYTRTTSRKGRAFLYVALFLVLIGGAIFVGNYFLSNQTTEKDTILANATPTPTIVSQVSPTDVASPTGTLTPSPTEEDEDALTVEILNGSGESGVAGALRRILEDAGYTVSSTGNADNFEYELTTIQIKKSKNSELTALKKVLSEDYSLDPKVGTLAESSDADAIVIIGAK